MAAPTNHWKLGLFVVVGFLTLVAGLVYLGAQTLKRDAVEYKSYFDESVQGLEVGSPVKFRGVTIGNVSLIDVAMDRRHVEVTYSMEIKTLREMGLAKKEERAAQMSVPTDMRSQIASAGITGVKFIQIDYFSEKEYPPPSLPFPLPKNYIPAAPSTMKNIEDALVKTVNQFPDLAGELLMLMNRINHFVAELDDQRLPVRVAETLSKANTVFSDVHTTVQSLDGQKLSQGMQQTMTEMNGALGRVNRLLANLEGDKGLLASTKRATDALGDTARGSGGLGRDLESTLRDVSEAAEAIRRLAQAVEQDPDMLLKGRAKRTP